MHGKVASGPLSIKPTSHSKRLLNWHFLFKPILSEFKYTDIDYEEITSIQEAGSLYQTTEVSKLK